MSKHEDDSGEPENSSPDNSQQSAYRSKLAVHKRDRKRCTCCGESFEVVSDLDADHIVPQGRGGPNTLRNKTSLCRRCHEAKHGERDHAPTIRCLSTGDMTQKDFNWFVHFWNHSLPALTELALEHRVKPLHDLADEKQYKAWHIPIGELRRLDEALADRDDIWYLPRKAHHYM